MNNLERLKVTIAKALTHLQGTLEQKQFKLYISDNEIAEVSKKAYEITEDLISDTLLSLEEEEFLKQVGRPFLSIMLLFSDLLKNLREWRVFAEYANDTLLTKIRFARTLMSADERFMEEIKRINQEEEDYLAYLKQSLQSKKLFINEVCAGIIGMLNKANGLMYLQKDIIAVKINVIKEIEALKESKCYGERIEQCIKLNDAICKKKKKIHLLIKQIHGINVRNDQIRQRMRRKLKAKINSLKKINEAKLHEKIERKNEKLKQLIEAEEQAEKLRQEAELFKKEYKLKCTKLRARLIEMHAQFKSLEQEEKGLKQVVAEVRSTRNSLKKSLHDLSYEQKKFHFKIRRLHREIYRLQYIGKLKNEKLKTKVATIHALKTQVNLLQTKGKELIEEEDVLRNARTSLLLAEKLRHTKADERRALLSKFKVLKMRMEKLEREHALFEAENRSAFERILYIEEDTDDIVREVNRATANFSKIMLQSTEKDVAIFDVNRFLQHHKNNLELLAQQIQNVYEKVIQRSNVQALIA